MKFRIRIDEKTEVIILADSVVKNGSEIAFSLKGEFVAFYSADKIIGFEKVEEVPTCPDL
jgi:hypothetical protein